MARPFFYDRDRDEPNDDYEDYDPDTDEDDDEPTVLCAYCRQQIHEEALQCPHCGNYQSDEDTPIVRKPWWIIIGTLACLFVIYGWIVNR